MSEEMIDRAREAWSRILNMDGGQPQAIAAGMWASIYAKPLLAAYNPNERLREALAFYAREWCEVGVGADSVKIPSAALDRDAGAKARSALSPLPQDGTKPEKR